METNRETIEFVAKMLQDDNLVWDKDFEGIRIPLSKLLLGVADLIETFSDVKSN